mmetsp:Transcript_28138/g.62055  ORF Transcript_28138/g.62055 Transcript_28138/m.62055 type:complete len:306 (-) Transcript_28138:121-1038(-)|eukprot:CAMPEP_0204271570 /NCGR_PEP_ID=MMETSP0468-20130131/20331_1 /ASSEMBLY_ACC=CAM_ASM_000383 /TAXON_ID=2969 /ORGANISM="Oxyrrhis marina" /LENGTH=305 /DNA_ID=CAMNT_0051247271 /DNA_START=30 /DNA_END=947 /DNA_ORIENTATION=+
MSRLASRLIRFVDTKGRLLCGQPKVLSETLLKTGSDTAGGSSAELCKVHDPLAFMNSRISEARELTGEEVQVSRLLQPIPPAQLLGIGLNYRKHGAEVKADIPKYPIQFMKTLNTLANPGQEVPIPFYASDPPEVDYEVELAVVIRRAANGSFCVNVPEEEVMDYVAGFTVANDLTARRWQGKKGGGQWCRAKSFDHFCPLGPTLVFPDEIGDVQNLRLTTHVNGVKKQDSTTADMIFSVKQLVAYLSQDTMLLPGTVILTGTPEGVGFVRDPPEFLKPGDEVEVAIEGIGSLHNTLVEPWMEDE